MSAVKQEVEREAAALVLFAPQLLVPWAAPHLQSTAHELSES